MKINDRFSFLQFFPGEDEIGEPDLEELQKEFEESWKPEESDDEKPDNDNELDGPEDTEGEPEDEAEEIEKENTETDEVKFPEQKQNEAFARMRRELEEKSKTASFLEKIAKKNGMTPDELIQAYEKQQLEAEAEAKGVPVDVYERLQKTEQELKQQKLSSFAKDYENQIRSTTEKYGLSEDDVRSTFAYLGKNGMINPDDTINIPFEDAYILANRDTFLEKAKEEGRQAYLEQKKQKQEGATVNTGGSEVKPNNSTDFSEEDVIAKLKEFDIQF